MLLTGARKDGKAADLIPFPVAPTFATTYLSRPLFCSRDGSVELQLPGGQLQQASAIAHDGAMMDPMLWGSA